MEKKKSKAGDEGDAQRHAPEEKEGRVRSASFKETQEIHDLLAAWQIIQLSRQTCNVDGTTAFKKKKKRVIM